MITNTYWNNPTTNREVIMLINVNMDERLINRGVTTIIYTDQNGNECSTSMNMLISTNRDELLTNGNVIMMSTKRDERSTNRGVTMTINTI